MLKELFAVIMDLLTQQQYAQHNIIFDTDVISLSRIVYYVLVIIIKPPLNNGHDTLISNPYLRYIYIYI